VKLLIFSDSHSALQFMRRCVEKIKPDALVHLGDHYDDGETIAELYPHIPMHQVAGNCDKYRTPPHAREMLCYPVGGVMLYMTHGHREYVKMGIGGLLAAARKYNAQAALYGHTHRKDCHREPDGLWVLNPGSAGYGNRTAGIIEVEDKKIIACRIIDQAALEEML
jgi:putative phosphoesterase